MPKLLPWRIVCDACYAYTIEKDDVEHLGLLHNPTPERAEVIETHVTLRCPTHDMQRVTVLPDEEQP